MTRNLWRAGLWALRRSNSTSSEKTTGEKDTPVAADITGVSAAVIQALAREWASKRTMLGCGARGGWGSACRQPTVTNGRVSWSICRPCRGWEGPGSYLVGDPRAPIDGKFFFPDMEDPTGRITGDGNPDHVQEDGRQSGKTEALPLSFPDAILNPRFTGWEKVSAPVHRAAIHSLHLPDGGPSEINCSTGTVVLSWER